MIETHLLVAVVFLAIGTTVNMIIAGYALKRWLYTTTLSRFVNAPEYWSEMYRLASTGRREYGKDMFTIFLGGAIGFTAPTVIGWAGWTYLGATLIVVISSHLFLTACRERQPWLNLVWEMAEAGFSGEEIQVGLKEKFGGTNV